MKQPNLNEAMLKVSLINILERARHIKAKSISIPTLAMHKEG